MSQEKLEPKPTGGELREKMKRIEPTPDKGALTATYTLTCGICGGVFYSLEAFPSPQLCPKCLKPADDKLREWITKNSLRQVFDRGVDAQQFDMNLGTNGFFFAVAGELLAYVRPVIEAEVRQICALEQQDGDPEWDGARHHPELDEPKSVDDKLREGIAILTGEQDYKDSFYGEYVTDADREIHRRLADRIIAHVRPLVEAEVRGKLLDTIAERFVEPCLNFYIFSAEDKKYALNIWQQVKDKVLKVKEV